MPAGLNNETLLLQRIDRQNNIIRLLQNENTCFRQIIQAYLLDDAVATGSERAQIKALIDESGFNSTLADAREGINKSNPFLVYPGEGINENNTFLHTYADGISNHNSFQRSSSEGTNRNISFLRESSEGNSETYINSVAARVRPFMKYSTQLSLVNTALILYHLHSDPATPLPHLRKLTGLSEDGMAKRIMALKKAGLIVRQSSPLRYVLTEKAKSLL